MIFAILVLVITVTTLPVGALAKDDNLLVNGGFEEEIYGEGNWKFPESGNWYAEGNAEKSKGEAKSLTLSENSITLNVGCENGVLDAIISPEYEYNKDIIWTSSKEDVAVVSANGIVTPVGEGTAVKQRDFIETKK